MLFWGSFLARFWYILGSIFGLFLVSERGLEGVLLGTQEKPRFLQRICLVWKETFRGKEREAPLRVVGAWEIIWKRSRARPEALLGPSWGLRWAVSAFSFFVLVFSVWY